MTSILYFSAKFLHCSKFAPNCSERNRKKSCAAYHRFRSLLRAVFLRSTHTIWRLAGQQSLCGYANTARSPRENYRAEIKRPSHFPKACCGEYPAASAAPAYERPPQNARFLIRARNSANNISNWAAGSYPSIASGPLLLLLKTAGIFHFTKSSSENPNSNKFPYSLPGLRRAALAAFRTK